MTGVEWCTITDVVLMLASLLAGYPNLQPARSHAKSNRPPRPDAADMVRRVRQRANRLEDASK